MAIDQETREAGIAKAPRRAAAATEAKEAPAGRSSRTREAGGQWGWARLRAAVIGIHQAGPPRIHSS